MGLLSILWWGGVFILQTSWAGQLVIAFGYVYQWAFLSAWQSPSWFQKKMLALSTGVSWYWWIPDFPWAWKFNKNPPPPPSCITINQKVYLKRNFKRFDMHNCQNRPYTFSHQGYGNTGKQKGQLTLCGAKSFLISPSGSWLYLQCLECILISPFASDQIVTILG